MIKRPQTQNSQIMTMHSSSVRVEFRTHPALNSLVIAHMNLLLVNGHQCQILGLESTSTARIGLQLERSILVSQILPNWFQLSRNLNGSMTK